MLLSMQYFYLIKKLIECEDENITEFIYKVIAPSKMKWDTLLLKGSFPKKMLLN